VLALVGCSDDDASDGSLAVGEDAPVTTAGNDTVPATEAVPADTVAEGDDTATVEDTTAASDEDQIRYAYETWIVFDTPADVRASLLEGGEAREDEIQAGFEEHESIIWDATIEVDTVTVLDADHAAVVFRVLWGGRPSPFFPEPLDGTAIRENGTWRVSRDTLCVLFAGALGGQCATGEPPIGPSETSAIASGSLPVVVIVSNQSFAIPSVDLVVTVDGLVVADATFPVDDQHTAVPFELSLAPGQHELSVATGTGESGAGFTFVVDDPEWITVFHSDDGQGNGRFDLQFHEEQPLLG
jgi:hypothetical protein